MVSGNQNLVSIKREKSTLLISAPKIKPKQYVIALLNEENKQQSIAKNAQTEIKQKSKLVKIHTLPASKNFSSLKDKHLFATITNPFKHKNTGLLHEFDSFIKRLEGFNYITFTAYKNTNQNTVHNTYKTRPLPLNDKSTVIQSGA